MDVNRCVFTDCCYRNIQGMIDLSQTSLPIVFTTCQFINTSTGMRTDKWLSCIDCLFTGGQNQSAFGCVVADAAPYVLTNCHFEDLLIAIKDDDWAVQSRRVRFAAAFSTVAGRASSDDGRVLF
jgi:hypothetical protein